MTRHVFVTGGTGYLGSRLVSRLVSRGHRVRALVRPGSEGKLPAGVEPVDGDPLDSRTFSSAVAPADTFVQLVGVPHPSPAKAAQFRSIDLTSALASISAAKDAGVAHFVYVSVAHPAPAMTAYSCPGTGVTVAARLWLADEVKTRRGIRCRKHRARGATPRSFAMRRRPSGSGGAGPSGVLPRLDDGKPSPSPRRLPAGPAALRTPPSLLPFRGTKAREEAEAALAASGLNATVLRPWYVLGPGHRWAYALIPFYRFAERIPATRDGARRLGLVTLSQMLAALVSAVENPAKGTRIVEVPEIRRAQTP